MRDIRFYLKPKYSRSRALVIGINEYQHCRPLRHAVNDANAIHAKLLNDFGFAPQDAVLLLNEGATGNEIRKSFLRFTEDDVELDDRILVFFAGHGITRKGMRGEVGYLAPFDANLTDLSTLIRWDELTRNIEIIPAKHIFFIMDACYGGLAVTRSVHSGSARFLRDMLNRLSRQVLTAGKADEQVADAGGPIPGHSVFTGHLLQGLDGEANSSEGILTANSLMAYVYSKVSADTGSFQTPHFGHIDGDGDFIFTAPILSSDEGDEKEGWDSLLVVPYRDEPMANADLQSKVTRTKALLSDPEKAIELHDFVVEEVKRFLSTTNGDSFSTQGSYSVPEMLDRLSNYESSTKDLATIEACIAYWAASSHRQILRKSISRSTDRLEVQGGLSIWLKLRWYPLILQTYCSGIAAIEAGRFDTLSDLFLTDIQYREKCQPLFRSVSDAISDLSQDEVFKSIPGYEHKYSPMSEYLFKLLQPQLDDALFIGRNYERSFDEFEILLALSSADDRRQRDRTAWGPVGRFGWKHSRGYESPFRELIERAKKDGERSPIIQHGLFGGEIKRFNETSVEYQNHLINLNWH